MDDPSRAVVRRLTEMRDRKDFGNLVIDGQAALDQGVDHPSVHRLVAQGLIEEGDLDEAAEVLEDEAQIIETRLQHGSLSGSAAPERMILRLEATEVKGLLGRVYKQRYVDAGPTRVNPHTELARISANEYLAGYRDAPQQNLWHGINYVAVRMHQQRLHPWVEGEDHDSSAEEVARELLATLSVLEEGAKLGVWDLATKAEAHLALGDYEQVEESLAEYVAHPAVTPFMKSSTARQLREVWELDPERTEHARLLSLLETAPETSQPGDRLQARFEDPRFSTELHDATARARARAVARIGRDQMQGSGTAFLLDARTIWPEYQGDERLLLLMTNAHVVSYESERGVLRPEEATVLFIDEKNGRPANTFVQYVELLWTSPIDELDCSVLLLGGGPSGVESYDVAGGPPEPGDAASIIGHPFGGRRVYSVDENKILRVSDRHFFYSTATEPGNSGSPVFDHSWRLIGIHRGESETAQSNYGIRMDKILEEAQTHLIQEFGREGPKG